MAYRGGLNCSRMLADRRGGIAVLTAVIFLICILMAAFAVDLSYVWLAKRQTQASADLAALAVMKTPERAQAVAEATVKGNGVKDAADVKVEWGRYSPDPAKPAAQRFVVTGRTADSNAARVTVRRPVMLFFGRFLQPNGYMLSGSAVAAVLSKAGISIGSGLLSLEGGLANDLLTALTGSKISLSLVNYKAIASGDVQLLGVLDALKTTAHLNVGTYDDLLGAEVTVGQLIQATAAASQVNDVKVALGLLGNQVKADTRIKLSSVIDLGDLGKVKIGQGSEVIGVKVSDLLMASLQAANGDNQLALNLGGNISGLASLKVALAIGERPKGSHWLSVGDKGVTVRTAQVRLKVEAIVLGGEEGLGALLQGLLGALGLIQVDPVRLPLYVEVAPSEATITNVTCRANDANAPQVDVAVRTGVAEAWIGDIDTEALKNFRVRPQVATAQLVGIRVLFIPIKILASAHAVVGSTTEQPLRFNVRDIGAEKPKTVVSTGLVTSLVTSLLGELKLEIVPLGGLGGILSGLLSGLVGLLTPITAVVDSLVDGLLQLLGLKLGAADVRLAYASCGVPKLVG